MTSGVRTSNAWGRKSLEPSGNIKPWSPRTGSWPVPWKRAGRRRSKKQRQVEEEYHRFLAKLPTSIGAADRGRIKSLAGSITTLWHAAGTSAVDRKQIIRCVVERVILVSDKSTENNHVTIVWQGGMTTQHEVARPVGTYTQLKDFRRLSERIGQLHREGLHLAQIAARLNDEGFVPPRRRGVFKEATIGSLMRELGLVGELFRDDLVEKDEWWIPDLAGNSASSRRRSTTGSSRGGSTHAGRLRGSI